MPYDRMLRRACALLLNIHNTNSKHRGIMNTRNFRNMLEAKWAEGKFVCVGLDPDYKKIPECVRKQAKANALAGREGEYGAVVGFCMKIVEATKDLVCAFKPNSAFFEGLSVHEGMGALHEV